MRGGNLAVSDLPFGRQRPVDFGLDEFYFRHGIHDELRAFTTRLGFGAEIVESFHVDLKSRIRDETCETRYSSTFFDQISAGSLTSARIVLRMLFEAIPVTSVVDVGCGTGPWLRAAIELGVYDVVGLDGNYVDPGRLMIEPRCFQPCDLQTGDLNHALATPRRFDLAMCLEVAEHLSDTRAESFVGELCDLSDLVLFSAAVPGQGGTNHVNEQWPAYWNALFVSQGFACFDVLRPRLWNEDACDFWYLQNLLLFARRETDSFAQATQLGLANEAPPLPLVHPRLLEHKLKQFRTVMSDSEATISVLRAAVAHSNSAQTTATAERDALAGETAAMRASTSWRITAPMRGVTTMVRRSLSEVRRR